MKERTNSFLLFISALLVISVGINIYQVTKANAQQERIINFIPQAVSMQDENLRLQGVEAKQKLLIEDLSYFKDSILSVRQSRSAEPPVVAPAEGTNPAYNPNPNSDQSFRDLNKNLP